MRKILIVIFLSLNNLVFTQNFQSQFESITVPTFNGSDKEASKKRKLEDIKVKTLEHIAQKTDSVFLRRIGLKENDSISFNIKYWVLADGTTPLDSVNIDTGVKTLDNYMKLMICSLPKFVPAVNLATNQNCEYQIDILSEFVVKRNRLMVFEKKEINDFKEPMLPVFESCVQKKSNKNSCLMETYKALASNFDLSGIPIPEYLKEIRLLINFTIDENGKATNIVILRSPISPEAMKNKIIQAFQRLPKFYIPKNDSNFLTKKFTLPITIEISNEGFNRRPYRNGYGFH